MTLDDAKRTLARVEEMKAKGKGINDVIEMFRQDVSSLCYSTAQSQIAGMGLSRLNAGPFSALPPGRLTPPGRI